MNGGVLVDAQHFQRGRNARQPRAAIGSIVIQLTSFALRCYRPVSLPVTSDKVSDVGISIKEGHQIGRAHV